MNPNEINSLVLAYIGDAIYEVYIRKYLVDSGYSNVNDLQKESIKYVSGRGQAEVLKRLMDNNFFSEEEIDVIKRTRNHKSSSHPKNCDIITYKHATAFEALIGYLYIANNRKRIDEIMRKVVGDKDVSIW